MASTLAYFILKIPHLRWEELWRSSGVWAGSWRQRSENVKKQLESGVDSVFKLASFAGFGELIIL